MNKDNIYKQYIIYNIVNDYSIYIIYYIFTYSFHTFLLYSTQHHTFYLYIYIYLNLNLYIKYKNITLNNIIIITIKYLQNILIFR